MDTSKKAESAHLLNDLESIRQLLGDDSAHSPLPNDPARPEGQIPLLFDVVGARPDATYQQDFDEDDIPTLTPDVQAAPVEQLQTVQQPAQPQALPNPDALLQIGRAHV